MTFTVTKATSARANRGLVTSDFQVLKEATVSSRGYVMTFSQWPDETEWYADFLMAENGYVHFSHGKGDRTVLKRPATAPVVEAIEKAFAEAKD